MWDFWGFFFHRWSEAFPHCTRQNFRGYFPGGEMSRKTNKQKIITWPKRIFPLCCAIQHFADGFGCRMLSRFARSSWNGTLWSFVLPSSHSPKIHSSESRPGRLRAKETRLPNILKCWLNQKSSFFFFPLNMYKVYSSQWCRGNKLKCKGYGTKVSSLLWPNTKFDENLNGIRLWQCNHILIWGPNHPVPHGWSISARSALQFTTMAWSASTQQMLFQFFYNSEIPFLHPCFGGTYCTVRGDVLFERSLKELSNNFSHRFEKKQKKTGGPKAAVCTKKVFKCLLLVRPSMKWRLYICVEGAYIFCI